MCVHEVLVNRLRGLNLPRKSVVRVTDSPNMTLAVYLDVKTTTINSKRPGPGCSKHNYLSKLARGQLVECLTTI